MSSSSQERRRALPRLHTAIDFRSGQLLGTIRASIAISPSHFLALSASDYSQSSLQSFNPVNDDINLATVYSPAMLSQFDLLVPTDPDIDVTCFELLEEFCGLDVRMELRDSPSLSDLVWPAPLLSSISEGAESLSNQKAMRGARDIPTLLDCTAMSSLLYSPSENASSPRSHQGNIQSPSPTSDKCSGLVLRLRGGDRAVPGYFRREQYQDLVDLDETPEGDTEELDADELAAHRANPVAEWDAFQNENAQHNELFMDLSDLNQADMVFEELGIRPANSPSSSAEASSSSSDPDEQLFFDARALARRNAMAGLRGMGPVLPSQSPLRRNAIAGMEDLSNDAPPANPRRRTASAAGMDDDMEDTQPAQRRRRNAIATGMDAMDNIQPVQPLRQHPAYRPGVPRREGLQQWQRRMGSVLPGHALPRGLTTIPEAPISPAGGSASELGQSPVALRPSASALPASARPVFVFGQGSVVGTFVAAAPGGLQYQMIRPSGDM